MNIMEIVGYIAIYLLIGWTLYPIRKSVERTFGKRVRGFGKKIDISVWPLSLLIDLFFIWGDGIFDFNGENNKQDD